MKIHSKNTQKVERAYQHEGRLTKTVLFIIFNAAQK
jgi:hypothetical protein